MKKALVLLALLLPLPAAARAQTIDGMVLEDSTRAPIPGVRVEMRGAGVPLTAVTDSTGALRLAPRPGGSFELRLRHPSYTAIDSVALTVDAGERLEVEFRMSTSPILLEPLVVRARADEGLGGFRDRLERRAFGRFVGRAEIDRHAGMRVSDMLRMVPGVRVEQGSPGTSVIVMRRAGTDCLPDLYIDGLRIPQSRDFSVDGFLNPATLEGVEVYTTPAAVPSVFASTSPCGAVAFWSRPAPPGRLSWKRIGIGAALIGLLFLLVR